MATKAETPSSSGTPAATAAPNASSRISSVPPIENCMDFASSARSVAPSAFCADASPYSSTRSCGWAFWTAATAASGASADFSSFSPSAAFSNLPGSVKFTTTERPSLETVLGAMLRVERALDVADAVDLAEATDDVLHRGGDLRIVRT